MYSPDYYDVLAADALAGVPFDEELALSLLTDPEIDLLPLVHAAYRVRFAKWGKKVQVHILNNAQNGQCPEDCNYCAQALTSEADIEAYPIKSDQEILDEARRAYEGGAYRYCMVFAGRGPNEARTRKLADLVTKIKALYPLEVCVSAGLMDQSKTDMLKAAGLDRMNHNLNTSRQRYGKICTTHTYDDRLSTLQAASRSGIGLCSGMIVGMGEAPQEIVEVAGELRNLGAASIPVNFLLPFEGNVLDQPIGLSPEYCLRVLCMFRLTNPVAEVRVTAGRELHFRRLEALSLYPANSLFLEGYLNSKGGRPRDTLQMIQDAGFEIESEVPLAELLAIGTEDGNPEPLEGGMSREALIQLNVVKGVKDLRPTLQV